jgi:uncharacterized protein (TIGR02598 family)
MNPIPPPPIRSSRRGESLHCRNAAFSLVEVTIAVGIVSFAVLTLLGIVPVGLMAAQEAARQTTCSHIVRQISSDLGMLSFSQMEAYLAEPQYYGYDGKRLKDGDQAVFVAELASRVPSYPGAGSLSGLEERLERVEIRIRRRGEPTAAAFRTTLSVFNASGAP